MTIHRALLKCVASCNANYIMSIPLQNKTTKLCEVSTRLADDWKRSGKKWQQSRRCSRIVAIKVMDE